VEEGQHAAHEHARIQEDELAKQETDLHCLLKHQQSPERRQQSAKCTEKAAKPSETPRASTCFADPDSGCEEKGLKMRRCKVSKQFSLQ